MSIKRVVKNKWFWLLSGIVLAAVPIIINGCGGDYDTPSTTQTPTALLSPATLKAWMDAGLVNGSGYDRVLIIDVNAPATYAAGHIDGAILLDSARMSENRVEGPVVASTEVPTGARMDLLIQEFGITKNTTIVFTGDAYWRVTRAYFIFRYWGFPKNRLKVLDGLNGAAVGADTYRNLNPTDWGTDAAPAAAATSYSVTDNGRLNNHFRLSLSEMIDYAEGRVPNAVAIDVRNIPTLGSYAGVPASTGSSFGAMTDQPVFEGHIKGAKAMLFSDLYNTNLLLKDTATLTSYFTAASVGLDSTKTAYLYCKLGNLGSITFFVLDGILGWPAAFYEGSWSQWGQLSANAAMGGMLDPNSPWRTDIASRSEVIVYNDPSVRPIEVLAYDGTACSPTNTSGTWTYSPAACTYVLPDSLATSGNQIEADDMEYMKSGSGGSGGGGGGGGC